MKLSMLQSTMGAEVSKAHRNDFEVSHSELLRQVRSDGKASAAERLSVYGIAYFERLVEVIGLDFPCTLENLGEEAFRSFISHYLTEYPSKYFNISEVGKDLAKCAEETNYADEYPFLVDLLKAEWSLIEVFYKEDFDESPYDWSIVSQDQWEKSSLFLNPTHTVIALKWDIMPLLNQVGSAEKNKNYFLAFRSKMKLHSESLSDSKYAVLEMFRNGLSLGQVSIELEKMKIDVTQDNMSRWLQNWVNAGLIVRLY